MHPDSIRDEARRMVRAGVSLNQVSRQLQVARSSIRSWLSDPRPVLTCPAPPQASAEYAALLGFYLGDGCLSQVGGAHNLRISCDATLPHIIDDVRHCIITVHPDRPVHLVHAPGVVVVQNSWKHWPCLFPQHGPGRKHERELGMAEWQWDIVERHVADFLRGLFHSDGCRVANWTSRTVAGQTKRYSYPRWQFVNASEEILRWCGDALDLVEIHWRRSGRRTLSVSRAEDVSRLDALIGLKG